MYWFYIMLTNKPVFKHDKNRFLSNWAEGGQIIFFASIVLSLAVSVGLTKLYLFFNFLER